MVQESVRHINALTSLRFFAALSVLLFHSGSSWLAGAGIAPSFVVKFFRNGYLGVSFFFILSGFILAYVYDQKAMNPRQVAFYARSRFARVYPAFFLSLLFMIPVVGDTPFSQGIWQFLMLQDWMPPAIETKYSIAIAGWNMQAWTLSVELFFYILFPSALRLIRRLSDRLIIVYAILACTAIAMLRLPVNIGPENLLYGWMGYVPLPILRAPEFLYGMLLGSLFSRGSIPRSPRILMFLVVVLIGAMGASVSLWIAPLAGILFGGIIALTPGSVSTGLISRAMISAPLVLLGEASYGIYIYQMPVRFFIRDYLEPIDPFVARLAYVPVLILISLVLLRYFEKPVRNAIRGS